MLQVNRNEPDVFVQLFGPRRNWLLVPAFASRLGGPAACDNEKLTAFKKRPIAPSAPPPPISCSLGVPGPTAMYNPAMEGCLLVLLESLCFIHPHRCELLSSSLIPSILDLLSCCLSVIALPSQFDSQL